MAEILALRQQLAILNRTAKRPSLHFQDRLFWIALAGFWKDLNGIIGLSQNDGLIIRWNDEYSRLITEHSETLYWSRRCQALPCHGFRLDNASSTDRCTGTSRSSARASACPAPAGRSCPPALADSSRRLVWQALRSNRADTNPNTTARHCRPCRRGRSRSPGTRGRAMSAHTRPLCRSSTESGPARCSRPTCRPASTGCPTHSGCDPGRRAPRIQTRLRSAIACPPSSRRLPRRPKRFGLRDDLRAPLNRSAALRGVSNSRRARTSTSSENCRERLR